MCLKLAGVQSGAVVYDPFVGTGTTLVAACRLGLRGIGTDVDEGYLDWARRRLNVGQTVGS